MGKLSPPVLLGVELVWLVSSCPLFLLFIGEPSWWKDYISFTE
jgi:hypothetical protein